MIDPRGMGMRDWFDAIVLDSRSGWSFGRLDDKDWQAYATGFLRGVDKPTIPDPYAFADWRIWAMRAAPLLENI